VIIEDDDELDVPSFASAEKSDDRQDIYFAADAADAARAFSSRFGSTSVIFLDECVAFLKALIGVPLKSRVFQLPTVLLSSLYLT
jgi:hypothetical protein